MGKSKYYVYISHDHPRVQARGLRVGLNIIDWPEHLRADTLPNEIAYLADVIVRETSQGIVHILKSRYDSDLELCQKVLNIKNHPHPDIALHLTDPNPFIREMTKLLTSKKVK